jgi:hypothetical protein
MTLGEVLLIPKGMTFEEYEKLLKEKHKLEKQIAKASDDIYDEMDSLDILSDEEGSENYNRHLQAKLKAESKRAKAQQKLNAIYLKLTTV